MVEYANELAKAPTLVKRDLLVLAAVYAHHGRPDLSVGFLTRDLKADPADKETCAFLIQLYNDPALKDDPRTDDRIGNPELCAAQRPGDPQAYLRLATSLWDKAYRDKALTDPQKLAYVERGLGHIDRALALDKDLLEAIVYKNLLLRTKAMSVTDPALQKRLLDEANDLQARSRAMMAAKGIPSSPPPAPPRQLAESVSGVPEVFRVGGVVKTPRKLKDVPPDYPAIAQSARVQGVVILECTIDPQGNVLDAKVLRSIPLLDQAAIDAVKQWVFEPSLYEGVPVTVIMTVTVNFKLS